jgi:hypothetical protein
VQLPWTAGKTMRVREQNITRQDRQAMLAREGENAGHACDAFHAIEAAEC